MVKAGCRVDELLERYNILVALCWCYVFQVASQTLGSLCDSAARAVICFSLILDILCVENETACLGSPYVEPTL